MQAAREASDLAQSGPLELNARVVFNPGTPKEKAGRLTIYRDGDRFRHELHVDDYHEVEVRVGGKRYVSRSMDYPSSEFFGNGDFDRLWQVIVPDHTKLSGVSTRTVDGVRAFCFEIRNPESIDVRKCFDAEKKVLLQSSSEVRLVKFSGYHPFGNRLVPAMIEVYEHGKQLRRIQDIEIEKARFLPSSFEAPPNSREFDTCADLQPARALRRPGPDSHDELTRESNMIKLYAIVGADGMLRDIKVLYVSDPAYEKAVRTKLPEWRYAPAVCGKDPVASEVVIGLGSSLVAAPVQPYRPRGR